MTYRIDNPVDLIAHMPTIIERRPTDGAWYTFRINKDFIVEGWTESADFGEAMVQAVKDKFDSIPAVVLWGGDMETGIYINDTDSLVQSVVVDCIQVFDIIAGTARVASMLCDKDPCIFCGSVIAVDPAPGQPYDGLPMAMGDIPFEEEWNSTYAGAEDLILTLLEKVESPYGAELFDQDELPRLAALISYQGGRDFMMAKCVERGAFPNMALRMIMDHGSAYSPAVQNATLALAAAYWPLSTEAAIRLVAWVKEQNPEHRMAHLMSVAMALDEELTARWLQALKFLASEETYAFDLPKGAMI